MADFLDGAGPARPRRPVGVVGLGTMGAGMASRLLDQGFDVVVYNRTAAKCAPLADRGAIMAASPREVAGRCDMVVTSVADPAAVDEVIFGTDGIAAALPLGGTIVDTSTVPPDFARTAAARAARSGHHLLDARILGNGEHAREGQLRFMVGGPEEAFARALPLLEALGKEVVHLGAHGTGAAMKLVLNMLMGVQMQALAEAVVFGERAGLRREDVFRAIAASGFSSPVMRFKCGVMQRRAFAPADFRLALMRKDMALVAATARDNGVPMAVADATTTMLTAAVGQGLGDLDCAAVLTLMEDLSGQGR